MQPIRVGVVEEHDIYRRGLVACLREDPLVELVSEQRTGPLPDGIDVAVVSARAAASERFPCPLVVCLPDPSRRRGTFDGNLIAATLSRSTVTLEQLTSTVRAAAAGLIVTTPSAPEPAAPLDERSLVVLRMLADGADTNDISRSLSYSERTIKGLIGEIERSLGARSRAQAVAEGIRHGLI